MEEAGRRVVEKPGSRVVEKSGYREGHMEGEESGHRVGEEPGRRLVEEPGNIAGYREGKEPGQREVESSGQSTRSWIRLHSLTETPVRGIPLPEGFMTYPIEVQQSPRVGQLLYQDYQSTPVEGAGPLPQLDISAIVEPVTRLRFVFSLCHLLSSLNQYFPNFPFHCPDLL